MSKARGQHGGGMFDRPGRLIAGVTLAVAFLWVTFTATLKAHELILGLLSTAITMLFFWNVLRTETMSIDLHLRDLLLARQLPGTIVKDCWLVTVVLFKDLFGKEKAGSFYRACGFKTSRRDPLLVGRSALAVAYSSMSPNMIAIGIDPAQSLMLFHQIRRDSISDFNQQLGAAPAATRDQAATPTGANP